MLIADVYVTINFYPTDKNGRKSPTDPHFFGCIFVVNEDKHECRLLLNEIGAISPGETKKRVPVKFLASELVMPKLNKGTKFYLWDMRNIAEGEVEEILAKQ